ncbi:MAG: glutamate synthase subunit alpha, partial [Candidatus Hydrogenedentota bacterium]
MLKILIFSNEDCGGRMKRSHIREAEGLYDPALEHDSCGVGFVANVDGKKTFEIIRKGIEVVVNLDHRGACGCDPRTGDGSGILLQIPDEFFRREVSEGDLMEGGLHFDLPPVGQYGVGMVFLPQVPEDRHYCQGFIEETLEAEGFEVLGWRKVPVDNTVIGEFARDLEPHIEQVFVKPKIPFQTEEEFERRLYICRKIIQKAIRDGLPRAYHYFYIASLSCRTIVYKGMLISTQLSGFFRDLENPEMKSALAIVHQRYSTNTFPTWDLAHPFRYLAHNGEINTLRGNINWMTAREYFLRESVFGEDAEKILPICRSMGSDSALLDNALEFLLLGGRSIEHAMMMMIPEAWENNPLLPEDLRAFYEFHAAIMEPWDGPAAVAFSDGRKVGALLDRNGLRPARYTITKNGFVVLASETGVLNIPADEIAEKNRLRPGKMLLIDTSSGKIEHDEEIKERIASRRPYRQWLIEHKVELRKLKTPPPVRYPSRASLIEKQQIFGYTREDLSMILAPMAVRGQEPVGSMGMDVPLAVLSDKPQLLYNYFKQTFAQVTNPPIDPIREEAVMSTMICVGGEGNVLDENPMQCHQIELEQPILTNEELEQIRHFSIHHFRTITLPILYHCEEGGKRLQYALDELCRRASDAVAAGY